jgi:RNA polymerase sigma-54 factor
MKQSLGLRTGLALTMTPALQQAIRLLQLSSLDLQTEIRQALESNVMLEADGDEGDQAAEALAEVEAGEPALEAATDRGGETALDMREDGAIPEDMPVDADWDDIYEGAEPRSSGSGSGEDEDGLRDFLQSNLHSGESLREHLLWQLGIAAFTPDEHEIALHLIDAINDDGYLEDWDGIVARLGEHGVPASEVERVLRSVQDFDPAGVAARDLGECLRLQLLQLSPAPAEKPAALKLVNGPIGALASRDEAHLARDTGLSVEEVRGGLALIQTLQPRPGRPFQPHESDYVAPDVHVAKKNGRWRVTLNAEHCPRLRVNPYYQRMIRRADTSQEQLTLKQHLQEARYFINSLEARNETLLKVAQCIVEEQRAFLDLGEEAMRPLVLRDVAERLGIHESTVSRATANKYMLTPRGLYELKYFFSSHVQTTEGGTCSATAIQAMIKRLIGTENPAKPLSDSSLADLLLKEGIQVARRTVAKYREALNIPPSHERKP